ncbi:MAG TPA: DUF2220 family protein [Phnomibacter sp.]|nr:DUF2220 family protein [Phnomibacter sp.]
MSVAAALHTRIEKAYWQELSAFILQQPRQWPLHVQAGKKLPTPFVERNRELEALYQRSSYHQPNGYHIAAAQRNSRKDGQQEVPVSYFFDNLNHLLAYLQKQEEYEAFVQIATHTLQQFPALQTWLATHPKTMATHLAVWPQVLQVLQYFTEHPLPQVYLREVVLPGVHTKFIEHYKKLLYPLLDTVLPAHARFDAYTGLAHFEQRFGLLTQTPMVHLRWLDASFAVKYTAGLQNLSAPAADLAAQNWVVKRVFVVENKTTYLQFEQYLPMDLRSGSLLLFGSGRAAGLLAGWPWLSHTSIYYWGDMDAEGFEILNQLTAHYSHTTSFCMDTPCWQQHQHLALPGSGAIQRTLPHIGFAQQQLYAMVCASNLRIEQEALPAAWVQQTLMSLIPVV